MSTPIDFIVRQGLQVSSNVVVGTYTLNVANPPTNGLIVSGNVGVGTSAPTQKLQVVGNIQVTNSSGSISGIYFSDGTFQNTSAASFSTPPGGSTNSIQFNAGGAPATFGGTSTFVYVSPNVGIGTSNPGYVLDVQSTASVARFATRSGNDYQIWVGNNTPSGNTAVVGYSNSNLYAYLTTGNTTNPTLVVTQTGNVGIGTTAPLNLLDVNGSVGIGTFAGTQQAPVNGMAVSGSLAIGVNTTTAKVGIVAGTSQVGLSIQGAATAGNFLNFTNNSGSTQFSVNNLGNITVGGYQGNVIAANYGGTGLTSYASGDLVYAASGGGIASLTRLPIGSNGNVLVVSGGLPTWGNVTVADISGVLPIANGGTNAAVFSGSAFVATTANGLVMTSVTSTGNAAVVFDNSGVPTSVTGGPYTYLTTGSGGGALSFGKVDLVNGVSGTLASQNGGTGQNTISQYQLLVGGATNNWNLLSSTATSALVSSVTGSLQWTSGTTANRVLRTDGSSITFSQVALTTDVTGILPYANGGTNSNTSWTQGSIIYAGASSFAQDNANFFWDATNHRLGLATTTPTTTLDVNGAATIRNGGNIVAGGLFVQAGVGNFVSDIFANSVTSNSFVKGTSFYSSGLILSADSIVGSSITSNSSVFSQSLNVTGAANVQGLTSNTTVIVSGTNPAVSTSTGALTVGGGAGITGNLYVGGIANFAANVFIGGNLIVAGNSTIINSSSLAIQDPVIDIGTAPNNAPLSTNDGYDKGLVIHYWDTTGIGDDHAVLVKQANNGPLIYATNVQPGVTNVANPFLSNSPGFDWGTMELGNIQLQSNLVSTSTSTGALVLSGQGGIGLGGSINAGGTGYFVNGLNSGGVTTVQQITSNTGISGTTISGSDQITGASIVSNSFVQGTSIYSSGPISAAGTITGGALVSNSSITATSLITSGAVIANNLYGNVSVASGGTLSSAGALTAATIASNSFIFGTTINTSGSATFASLFSNGFVQGSSVSSTGPISAAGTITGANLVSNAGIQTVNFYATGAVNGASTATFANIVSNGYVQGTSVYSSGPISAVGAITAASLVSNSFVNATSIYSSGPLSAAGALTVSTVTSNGFIFGSSLNTSGTATVNALASNGLVSGSSLYASGTINTGGLASFANIVSNGYVQGASIYSSGPVSAVGTITAANLVSNAGIQTVNFYATGAVNGASTATFANIVSNGYVQGASVYSSGAISAVGTITAANLTSNASVQTVNFYASGAINGASTATFANITSNGYVQGASVYSSGPISAVGAITAASLTSNSFVYASSLNTSGTATVNNFVSNGYVQAASVYSSGSASAVGSVTASTLVSNTSISGNTFILNGNVATTSTTGAVTLDIYDKTIYRTSHYYIQVTDNTAAQYHSEQIMLLHDGTTVYKTEYNLIYSAAPLGTFDSSISGNQVSLTFTATAATNKTIKVIRTAIDV
jgi:hypothetical protein